MSKEAAEEISLGAYAPLWPPLKHTKQKQKSKYSLEVFWA